MNACIFKKLKPIHEDTITCEESVEKHGCMDKNNAEDDTLHLALVLMVKGVSQCYCSDEQL